MTKKIIFIISLFFTNISLANSIEIWNSKEGLKRLQETNYNNDFYQLVNFYQPQINPLYCSPASATIIINAINYGKIQSQKTGETYKPESLGRELIAYNLYSQEDFFNEKTEKVKTKSSISFITPYKIENGKKIFEPGVNLEEFSRMLKEGHNFDVKKIYAKNNDKNSLEKFRKNLKEVLSEDKKFILANFHGKVAGSQTNGHISPLVAYDEDSDMVLVLDVALHKNNWFWVDLTTFYLAMNTKDGDNYRGYLIVKK